MGLWVRVPPGAQNICMNTGDIIKVKNPLVDVESMIFVFLNGSLFRKGIYFKFSDDKEFEIIGNIKSGDFDYLLEESELSTQFLNSINNDAGTKDKE